MTETNNSSKPEIIIDGKAFDLSKIDLDSPELMAHIEAWLQKKVKAFDRAEKKRLAARKPSSTSRASKTPSGNSRFVTFVKSNPSTDDPAMKSFYSYVKRTANFPQSSNPRILAVYLYLKLDRLQIKGFQLYMILYKQQPGNQLPKDLHDHTAFLNAINAIVPSSK